MVTEQRMRLLGRFKGRFGDIDVVECLNDGTRMYLEGDFYQSQSTSKGHQPFPYVPLMAGILSPADNILLLGCGGGTLATMLAGAGKLVSVVDRNPLSFVIAQRFFGMPSDIPCVCADFRDFLRECHLKFDGIAIDVSGPDFDTNAAFDKGTCELLLSRLSDGGRVTMNVCVTSDLDPAPDVIARRLASNKLHAWIFDQTDIGPRNVILACCSESTFDDRQFAAPVGPDDELWVCRRPRRRKLARRPASPLSY